MDTTLRQTLRAKAHHLNPVILLGAKGLTEAVVLETDIALESHELIKVKMNGMEKTDRLAVAESLSAQLKAEIVQIIGNTAVLYRKKQEVAKPKPVIPAKSKKRIR